MSHSVAQDLEDLKHWITSAWFERSERSAYQAALQSLILHLWPERKENSNGSTAYTFLNLPALCYRSLGGAAQGIIPVNCAWIFLYAAFYLLDKVEDQETENGPFSRFGDGPLTNLTTGLILNAGQILSTVVQETGQIRAIQMDFYRQAGEVCAGQHLDLTLQKPDLDQAWAIAAAKSGNFFSLGCRMGAGLSSADPDQVDAFARYGCHLGTLVQIANDYDGLFPNKYGKSDIITGKYNIPIAYSFLVLPDHEKEILSVLLAAGPADSQAKQRALQMIVQSGALLYLYLEAEKQKSLAAAALDRLALVPEIKNMLLSLPEKIVSGLQQVGVQHDRI